MRTNNQDLILTLTPEEAKKLAIIARFVFLYDNVTPFEQFAFELFDTLRPHVPGADDDEELAPLEASFKNHGFEPV